MKISEIVDGGNNRTVERLLWLVEGSTYAAEIEVIKQRLVTQGTEPTSTNVKRHLVNHLLLPTELMNEPERAIILWARRADWGE